MTNPTYSTILLKLNAKLDPKVEIKLSHAFWNVEVKPVTIQNVVVAEQAAHRLSNSQTKDRSEVSGGGRKPWKQKGTGRARHGSIRSPIWTGGGVTFGPTNQQNFRRKVNRKIFRKAFAGLLTNLLREKRVFIAPNCKFKQANTKQLLKVLTEWNCNYHTENILWIDDRIDINLELSAKNVKTLKVLSAHQFGVLNLIKADKLLITESALTILEKRLQSC